MERARLQQGLSLPLVGGATLAPVRCQWRVWLDHIQAGGFTDGPEVEVAPSYVSIYRDAPRAEEDGQYDHQH